jgi:hypothetical protein
MKMKQCLKDYRIGNLAIMSIIGKMKGNSKLKESNKYVCILPASLKRKGIQEGKIMKTKKTYLGGPLGARPPLFSIMDSGLRYRFFLSLLAATRCQHFRQQKQRMAYKKVQIKRIFTYDLVADPGFENAQLSKVNESFGFDNHDDTVAIYDVTTEFPAFLESMGEEIYTETAEKSNKNNMEKTNTEFVSVEEMNKYSLVLKEEIQKINDRLAKISESGFR